MKLNAYLQLSSYFSLCIFILQSSIKKVDGEAKQMEKM